MELNVAASVAGLIAFAWLIDVSFRRRKVLPSPPGPSKLPLLGHITVFPKEKPWEQFHAWSKKLGTEIIELNVLGMSLIILDTAKAAHDLLDNRSAIYSNRPRMPMVNELMGWDFNMGAMPYGPRWRAHRKVVESSLNRNASRMYEGQEMKVTRRLLLDLLEAPSSFLDHFRSMAGSLVLGMTYGIETKPSNDPFIKISEDGIQPVLEAVVPGTYLVDLIPAMKYIPEWMPFAKFQKVARETRLLSKAMLEEPFAETKRMMATGQFIPSFVSSKLQDVDGLRDVTEQETIIQNSAATMYSAATDNIIATLAGFLVAMLSNPDAQQKAQAEIDSVLPNGHLPTFADRDSLPYVTALTIEVFRCAISSPLGGPHVLEADDEYRGFGLPKNAIVMANIWAILHDEDKYPDPFAFKPERFLNDGQLVADSEKEVIIAFGFGRRICPGRHTAFSTVWIAIASMLATFNISKAIDEDGNPITPELVYSKSTSCLPTPFKCLIEPRSQEAARLVTSSS